MGFQTIKVQKIRKRKYPKKDFSKLRKILFFSFLFFCILGLVGIGVLYQIYIKPLPPISKLEQMDIKEASVIYDKEGKELYTLFGDEKRTYVGYNKISKNMVNAIVSGEDQHFFVNPGIDFKGLMRAVYNYATGRADRIEGTSTISQQLIKNVFLSNERKLERKLKELYLSYEMTRYYSKEKILELYLNKISFGSNAFGVEQASLTFFRKHVSDVNILEASILASIPKGPTYFSPYNHYDRLVGNLYTYPKTDENSKIQLIKPEIIKEHIEGVEKVKNMIKNIEGRRIGSNGIQLCGVQKTDLKKSMNFDKDGCIIMDYPGLLTFLNAIRIEDGEKYIEYQTGRKDFILGRMLDDQYISWDEYKATLIESIGFEFKEYRENIKYPYFVMYVREYLTQKYGEQILEEGGLKIYTSIDPKLQAKAEEIIKKQVATNYQKYDADNAALISIDNSNGDILAFVGGSDYHKEKVGNVNMITSKRQPGSSFKPIVYALAIDKNPFGPDTPIYDLPTTFPGGYEPKNYNGKFSGRMTLTTALNHSRNIPAIKLYFLAGEQKGIIDYLKTVGVKSLDPNFYYGAPMALGTGEMTPLEMAQVYSVFPNNGNKVEINPIVKILDSRGLLIEQKKKTTGKNVLDPKTAYIMATILSNTASRPDAFWNANLALKDRKAGAKTGTSNKLFVKGSKRELLPGDLWTAGFTKQITTVVWAGNTDGKAIKPTGDGLNGAAPIWKEFMEFAHQNKEKLDWEKPEGLKTVKISRISGLLAPAGFDPSFTLYSMFKNIPTKYDTSLKPIEYDAMCNGKVGPNTPPGAIRSGYYVAFSDVDPKRQSSIDNWAKQGGAQNYFQNVPNIVTNYTDKECERNENLVNNSSVEVKSNINENDTFVNGSNYVEIGYKSTNPLRNLQILIDNYTVQEIDLNYEKSGIYKGSIKIPSGYEGNYILTIRAVDSIYYSSEETKSIQIIQKDTTPPKITLTNPENNELSLYNDQYLILKGTIEERSSIKTTNIIIDGVPFKTGLTGRTFSEKINTDHTLSVGMHTIKVESIDLYFNKSEVLINLEIMQR